jgi:hypothetical protein
MNKPTIKQVVEVFADNLDINSMTWHDAKEDTIRYLVEDCDMSRIEAISLLDLSLFNYHQPSKDVQ